MARRQEFTLKATHKDGDVILTAEATVAYDSSFIRTIDDVFNVFGFHMTEEIKEDLTYQIEMGKQ